MIPLIVSLVGLAVSGLTFLAYKHPKAYSKLFHYLWPTGVIIYLLLEAWNAGIGMGCVKAINLIAPSDVIKISISDALAIPDRCQNSLAVPHLLPVTIASLLYLWLLVYLPELISDSEKNEADSTKGTGQLPS